jgi:hypothetical protein
MKLTLLFLTVICCISCKITQEPLNSTRSDNNKTYDVDYLFTHDGCKVYRFYDRGNYVYFTNCTGETIVKTDSTEIRNKIDVTRK